MHHSCDSGRAIESARGAACLERIARRGLSGLALGLLALSLAGCSMTIPFTSFSNDDATSSIKAASPLSPDLDMTDWRIAEPVLARALLDGEPEAPARWSNPDSGRSGAFQPVAVAFSREGKSCRAFVARIAAAGGPKMLQAIGCPDDSGEVALDKVQPWKGL
jgi:hypothetical protein